jgi:hypothetical protein
MMSRVLWIEAVRLQDAGYGGCRSGKVQYETEDTFAIDFVL